MEKITFIFWMILAAIGLSSVSQADWLPESAAPIIIVNSIDNVTVDKDGLSTSIREVEMKAVNEQGRSHLVNQSIPYVPDATKVEVLKASSITDGIESPVNIKKVTVRTAGGGKEGISHVKEVLIPFNNIKIGSITKYTVRVRDTKNLVKGLYSMTYVFGTNAPELAGKAKIRSIIPLHVKINDPWGVLVSKEYKDGKYYVFEFEQIKPVFKIPSEANPILRNDKISMIEISTMNSWNAYVSPIAEKYEKILQEKVLPPVFQKIVDQASKATKIQEKIDIITSELATVMTYSGDWTSFDKMFFPKKISEIGKLKVGDCKDFSLATVAMLRKMGIDANVAMTKRKSGGGISGQNSVMVEPISTSLVSQGFFNHAIVKVKDQGKIIWVDPTNMVSNSGYTFLDIAGSYTLDVARTAMELEKIPHPELGSSRVDFEKSIKIAADNTVESVTDFELTGDYAKYVVEAALARNEDTAHKVMMAFLRTDSKSAKSFYEGFNFKNRVVASLKGRQKSLGESLVFEKDNKKYFIAPLALSLKSLSQVGDRRVTDMNMESTFSERTTLNINGYDFVGFQKGCTILSPWFTVRRKFIKIQEGFQVQDVVDFKKVELSAKDINSDKFQMSVGDVESCAITQAVEIRKLDISDGFSDRLKDYTIQKAKDEYEISGPKSIDGARNALHIVEQILSKEPKDKEARILKAKAVRMVGYKNNSIDLIEYWAESDEILTALEKEFPQDPQMLIQKSWLGYLRKNQVDMMSYFKKAYAVSPKNWSLYNLGAEISERMEKYDAALKSHAKALELANTKYEKGSSAVGVAEMYFKKNQYDKAISYYKYAISANPENTWVAGNFMGILHRLGKWDDAIATGEEIMKTSAYGVGKRLLADAYAGKANSISRGGKDRGKNLLEMEGYYAKGLQVLPSNAKCLEGMTYLYFEKAMMTNDPAAAQRALSYFEKATTEGKMEAQKFAGIKASLESIASGKSNMPRMPANVTTTVITTSSEATTRPSNPENK